MQVTLTAGSLVSFWNDINKQSLPTEAIEQWEKMLKPFSEPWRDETRPITKDEADFLALQLYKNADLFLACCFAHAAHLMIGIEANYPERYNYDPNRVKQEIVKGTYSEIYAWHNGRRAIVSKIFTTGDDQLERRQILVKQECENILHVNQTQLGRLYFVNYYGYSTLFPYDPLGYISMEYMDGPNLDKLLNDWCGSLTTQMKVTIVHSMLTAINYLHQECKMVHGNLAPKHWLFSAGLTKMKLADFAYAAKIQQSGALLTSKQTQYPLEYRPPEFFGAPPFKYNEKADIYSLSLQIMSLVNRKLCSESQRQDQMTKVPSENQLIAYGKLSQATNPLDSENKSPEDHLKHLATNGFFKQKPEQRWSAEKGLKSEQLRLAWGGLRQ